MKKNKTEKSLVKMNENSVMLKIKKFFSKIFGKEKDKYYITEITDNELKKDTQREQFKKYIKNIENEETKLIKLQQQYRNREIKEEQLTPRPCWRLLGIAKCQLKFVAGPRAIKGIDKNITMKYVCFNINKNISIKTRS